MLSVDNFRIASFSPPTFGKSGWSNSKQGSTQSENITSTILITGAPGNVGSEVVEGLLGKTEIRVAAHNVETARQILDNNSEGKIDFVPFDFLDPSTFAAAFSQIETLFLVRPPALSNVNRNIAPALNAAKKAGVRHIVFVSIQGVEHLQMVPHSKIEQLITSLGFRSTFLRCGFFMQNLSTTHRNEIRDHDEIALPVGKGKTSFIDVRDIASVAVLVLLASVHVNDGFTGENANKNHAYTLTGSEALDYNQVAAILSSELGRTIRYTNPFVLKFIRQQVASGRKFGFALLMAALYTLTRFGNAKEVTQDVRGLLNREPILFAQFANDYRDLWIP